MASAQILRAVAFLSLLAIAPASALELSQAIENCRNSVGRPIVIACMRGGGSFDSCRASAYSKVKGCVHSAMEAARPKAALFDAAKLVAPKPEELAVDAASFASNAPRSLVAPPRTISDITAILDQQKPDPA